MPFPIDPFRTIIEQVAPGPSPHAADEQPVVSAPMHAYPALPTALSNIPQQPSTAENLVTVTAIKRKAPLLPPKTSIPDFLIPLLLDKINQLQTGNLTWLIDSIFHELKQYSVKRNAIEAKVREVGEKCAYRRIWIVKPSLVVSTLAPSTFSCLRRVLSDNSKPATHQGMNNTSIGVLTLTFACIII